MFTMKVCPHCANARKFMDELFESNSEYKKLNIEIIDETEYPDIADQYDYYYVPTYYLDGIKFHEGIPEKKMVEDLFRQAYEG